MKLIFTIELHDKGISCSGNVDGDDVYGHAHANAIAIGALEVAKASLLAQRWGLRLNKPIIEEAPTEVNGGAAAITD